MTLPPFNQDPRKLRVLRALTELIQGITSANGYVYDLSAAVFRGRLVFGESDPMPCVTILETLRPDANPGRAGAQRAGQIEMWDVLVQGFAKVDPLNPTDALYLLSASVQHRMARIVQTDRIGNGIYPEHYLLGKLVAGAAIGPGVVRAATPQTGGTECMYIPCTFEIATTVTDPWA